MKPKIESLRVEQFRALRQIKIDGLGRVNLITGRNNTGKSSILESLRLLASRASLSVIKDILRMREEDVGDEGGQTINADESFAIMNLFHALPALSDKPASMIISTNGSNKPLTVKLDIGWFDEVQDSDGGRRLIPRRGLGQSLLSVESSIPALTITEAHGNPRTIPLSRFNRSYEPAGLFRSVQDDDGTIPCFFVSPYGGERTTDLGALWDRIALQDLEKDVVAALRIIEPDITGVVMVGGDNRSGQKQRIAKVRAEGLPRPVPLRSYGDGLNRLFGIALSLVNAKNGLLLIDEFENGMHYSVLLNAWRIIFEVARRLDIQVFATTHSWDAIETFQKAASEAPEDGVLVRLTRKDEKIIPTVFAKDELAIVTRDRIEVR